MISMFEGCHNLTDISVKDSRKESSVNMTLFFRNCEKLFEANMENAQEKAMTNIPALFKSDERSSVMDEMIPHKEPVADITLFFESNIRQIMVNEVNMDVVSGEYCGIIGLNIKNFDTKNVKFMSYMFKDCGSLTYLNLSNFDMSSVKKAASMLSGCNSLMMIDTPYNLQEDIFLPDSGRVSWHQPNGEWLSALPKQTDTSIRIRYF